MAKSIEGDPQLLSELSVAQTRFGVIPSSTADAPAVNPFCSSLKQRFDCIRLLGSGGVGEVWLAHDSVLDRLVALKVMKRVRHGVVPSLLDEARATALVRHPHVVSVLDAGTFRGELFIAFEYVEGQTLRAKLRRLSRTLDDRAHALRWLHEVAAGLAAAHDADVLHLDVKPENILIGAIDQRARILDFGLAQLRHGDSCVDAGATAGTPGYMAPELFTGDGSCDGTDVWAFAVLTYEVLTGTKLFVATSPADMTAQVLALDGLPPERFGDVVERYPALGVLLGAALQRNRRGRPTMHELERALADARTPCTLSSLP